jgi:conjugal transfer/entry exclusion protein
LVFPNWDKIDNEIAKICVEIDKMENDQIDINTIWETFKRKLKTAIDENIPSKIFKKNKNLPWFLALARTSKMAFDHSSPGLQL